SRRKQGISVFRISVNRRNTGITKDWISRFSPTIDTGNKAVSAWVATPVDGGDKRGNRRKVKDYPARSGGRRIAHRKTELGGASGGWNRSSRPMQSIGKTPVKNDVTGCFQKSKE